jgi:NAD(P)-dependent dehydrogenase (short-subunit alcohol dehydrogenase family)
MSGKLASKVALITGADGPIARATAQRYAEEGADVALVYHQQEGEVEALRLRIEALGRRCLLIDIDPGLPDAGARIVERTVAAYDRIDVLVNNAIEVEEPLAQEVTREQLETAFKTQFFALFDLCRSALPHMARGSCIINATSADHGSDGEPQLDAASMQGAILGYTQSLARQVAWRRVRVNALMPGPVWTPQVPATYSPEELERMGRCVPPRKPRAPDEVSPCFVYLASDETTGLTGQVLQAEDCEPASAV